MFQSQIIVKYRRAALVKCWLLVSSRPSNVNTSLSQLTHKDPELRVKSCDCLALLCCLNLAGEATMPSVVSVIRYMLSATYLLEQYSKSFTDIF